MDRVGETQSIRHLRPELEIEIPRQPKRLPHLPSDEEIRRYYEAVWRSRNAGARVLLKTLLYTAMTLVSKENTGSRPALAPSFSAVCPLVYSGQALPWRQRPATIRRRMTMQQPRTQAPVIAPDLIVPIVADDTEEAPWMVMGDRQFWSATNLVSMLHIYALTHHLPWYVAGLLPIRYRRPGEGRKRQVAPDVMVAFVPQRPRDSYDLEQEGDFPAFVLEVLSQSSVARDTDRKRRLYEALGRRSTCCSRRSRSCSSRRCRATAAARQGASSPCDPMRRDGCGVRC